MANTIAWIERRLMVSDLTLLSNFIWLWTASSDPWHPGGARLVLLCSDNRNKRPSEPGFITDCSRSLGGCICSHYRFYIGYIFPCGPRVFMHAWRSILRRPCRYFTRCYIPTMTFLLDVFLFHFFLRFKRQMLNFNFLSFARSKNNEEAYFVTQYSCVSRIRRREGGCDFIKF